MEKPSLLQPVTEEVRRQAKGLLRSERHAALSWLTPAGAPGVSRVALATAQDGAPIILISQLSPHFAALENDPRCSLLVGTPGKGDPLAHPRMTVHGRATNLSEEQRAETRARYLNIHPKAALYVDFADFAFWRITPEDASLNGGFAKAYELVPSDLVTDVPDGMEAMEAGAVEHMNEDHLDAIALYAETLLGLPAGNWRMAAFDAEGLDLAAGDETARLWFNKPLKAAAELRPKLVALAKRAREKA